MVKFVLKLLLVGLVWLPTIQSAHAAYECPDGFYWSRETIACEQTDCPANSHRNYTLECICDVGFDTATYKEIGLLESCSVGQPNTNSVEATTPNVTNATVSDEVPTLTASDDELANVLPYVPTERQAQFNELIRRYRDTIPRGVYGYGVPGPYEHLFSPGQMNNLVYGANATACGGYQDQVLKWLLSIYFSANTTDQALLDGFDFGPIQITKGAHQAVVIYPQGTDWRSTGIVFDPWPEQTPRLYTINEWDGMFLLSPTGSTGNIITPIDSNLGIFPTTPNSDGTWEYDDVYTAGSRQPRNRSNGGRRLAVRSPVDVVVIGSTQSVGVYSDGSFVNDYGSTIEGYVTEQVDGTYYTDYNLPDDTYGVAMTATGSGDVHVYAGIGEGEAVVFDTVTVNAGDQLILGWEEGVNQPQLFDNDAQEVSSQPLTDVEPPVIDTNNSGDQLTFDPTETNTQNWLGLSVILLVGLVTFGLMIVVIIVIVLVAKKYSAR
ncbi:MAG: hypothetical protein HY565_05600 [Candidatus Kerfeldbacteria bacterium]|nr:hypothetical protein [Candidatus Kerfeldbacteria bacterium]